MHKFQLALRISKRLKCEEKRLQGLLGIALLLGVLIVACIESDSRLDRLFSLHIETTDLPEGWYRNKGGIGDRDRKSEDTISRWVAFQGVPEQEMLGVFVRHELTDYPDPDQAIRAYTEIVKEEFPVKEWTWPEQVHFESRADQFRLACLEWQMGIYDDERLRGSYSCRAVGQYGTIISVIYANVFQDQWLTFEDLQRLLEAADARLASQP
jgi:hypothetical protein